MGGKKARRYKFGDFMLWGGEGLPTRRRRLRDVEFDDEDDEDDGETE